MATREQIEKALANIPTEERRKWNFADDKKRQEYVTQLASKIDDAMPKETSNLPGIFGVTQAVFDKNIGVMDQLERFADDGVKDIVGFIHGATGGLLQPAIRKMEQETGMVMPEGSALGKLAGVVLGPGKLARFATKGIQGFRGASFVRGATEGAIAGFTAPTQEGKEFDLKARGEIAGIGAVMGLALEPLIQGVAGYAKFTKAEKDLIALKSQKKEIDLALKQGLMDADDAIRAKKAIDSQITNVATNDTTRAINEQIKELDRTLKVKSEESAQALKKPILKWMREFRDSWGRHFDELLENSNEAGLTVKKVKDIENSVIAELRDAGVELKGAPLKAIRNFSRQVAPGGKKLTILDKFGNVLKEADTADDTIIPNARIVQAKRAVSQSLSSQSRGLGQYTQEDLAGVIFNKKISNALEEVVPGLKEWNGAYKKFMDLSKFAYKRLGAGKGEFETPASTLIRKVVKGEGAKGGASIHEIRAVKMLEKKSGIKFTKDIKNLQDKIDELNKMRPAKVQKIETELSREIAKLNQKKQALKATEGRKKLELDKQIKATEDLIESLKVNRYLAKFVSGATLAGGFAVGDMILGSKFRGALTNVFDASN